MQTYRQIAEKIVNDRIARNNRKLHSLALNIIANRERKNEIIIHPKINVQVPEQATSVHPTINLPPMEVTLPSNPVNVHTVVEDQREVQAVNVNVDVTIPPEAIKIDFNPTINIPQQKPPTINVNVSKQDVPTIEVNIPEQKKEEKHEHPSKAVIKHSDGTTSTVKLEK